MKKVRIGAAQGFYGDTIEPAVLTAKYGDVQYLCFDCLAELTMAILAKDYTKNPSHGYTKDLTNSITQLLPFVKEKGIKLLTNAGGINPIAAKDEVMRIAKELGMDGLKVAVVTGDNVLESLPDWYEQGMDLSHADTNEPLVLEDKNWLFANAYLGVWPIVEALQEGAQIVITGRTTDPAQFLAPLIYEFGWTKEEWDKLASGIMMGHLLECSAQSTGGNYSGDWEGVPGMDSIGYPIAEVEESGEFIITKIKEAGGLVSFDTVREQLLYEIHDPSAYLTPDVIVDLSKVTLTEVAPNKVRVTGIKGKPAPSTLKVVLGYEDGFLGQALMGYSWPDAYNKAQKAQEIIRQKVEMQGNPFEKLQFDFVGYNSLHGPLATPPSEDINEIYLRIAVKAKSRPLAQAIQRYLPPLALNGPPSLAGFFNIPPRQLLGMWSMLVDRQLIEQHVQVKLEVVSCQYS